MKTKILFLSLFILFICHLKSQSQPSPLDNIQQKIETAFTNSFTIQNDSEFLTIDSILNLPHNNKIDNLYKYWKSYNKYYHAIYFLQFSNDEKCKPLIKDAIDNIENIKNKTSEDYALLVHISPIYFKYAKPEDVPKLSEKLINYAQKAIDLDTNNIRAWFVSANYDFYIPEEYGGGLKVEKHTIKALSLPDQTKIDPKLPSWGRSNTYSVIVQYFMKKDDMVSAKKYFDIGIEKFPNDLQLNNLSFSFY